MRSHLPKLFLNHKILSSIAGLSVIFLLTILVLILLFPPLFGLKEISLPSKDAQKFTSKYLRDREDPLFGVNGVVSEIENEANTQKVLKIRSDIGPTYTATINEDTLIFIIIRNLAQTEVETIRMKSTPEDIKVGSKVYTRSKKDLLVNFNLAPEDIKGIDIYVN